MSVEERLRNVLQEAATDPGAKEDWETFFHTARRDRLTHRIKIAAAVGAIGITVALGFTFGNDLIDQTLPDPAKEEQQEQEKRTLEEEVEEAEERVRDTKELIEGSVIAPGPGRAPRANRGDARVGSSEEGTGRSKDDPVRERIVTASATCRGTEATIVGTSGDDILQGTSGPDVIAGLAGADTIRGGGGLDYICAGEDVDHLYGEAGRDSLVGGGGDDYLDGGAGLDFVHFPNAIPNVDVDLSEGFAKGEGKDVLVGIEGAEGTQSDDTFVGTNGVDIFVGGGGPDTVNAYGGDDVFFPGPGDDAYGGFGGMDTVHLVTPDGVKVDLSRGRATGEGLDFLSSVENVSGTPGDDVISGNDKPNGLSGGGGSDTISGGIGADLLSGGDGNDTLDGGPFEDSLDGGAGVDTCTNGEDSRRCETSGPLGTAVLLTLFALARRRSKRRALREACVEGRSPVGRFF